MPGGLATLLDRLGRQHGIEIDADDLEAIGLSADDVDGDGAPAPAVTHEAFDFSAPLPGTAGGVVELFLDQEMFGDATPAIESPNGLMYYPIIRSGQWAVRPGTQGTKKRTPLKVVSGKSKNSRREIGLQDLHDNFHDGAIQHVTVPSSHNNTVLENTGFVDDIRLVDGEVKNAKTKKMDKVKVLLGGYRITEPDVKGKMKRGTIANRSAGILYDYVNTETGKSYNSVLEHVALTNKPWITGMISFGRPLADSKINTVGLSLSNEGPSDDEYALVLSEELKLGDEEKDFLTQESDDWSKEGSPNWLRRQVQDILDAKRAEKIAARNVLAGGKSVFYDDYPPNYRCVEAKPGKALISDGWGDDSNFWAASISTVNGAVEIVEFTAWSSLKKAFIADERPAPAPDKLPLNTPSQAEETTKLSRLQLAQEARRQRGRQGTEHNNDTDTREVVGNMAGDATLVLSDEAQAAVDAANARAAAAEADKLKLSERVDRLMGTVNGGEVDKFISFLKTKPDAEKGIKGLGLSEDLGFSGLLTTVRELMLNDDGEPAVQAECFSTDANKVGELTLSDAIKRVFGALEKAEHGKASLGEALAEPADPEAAAAAATAAAAASTELDENGKPKVTAPAAVTPGKPGAGDEVDGTKLSTEDIVAKTLEVSPGLAAMLGRSSTPPADPAASASEGGGK